MFTLQKKPDPNVDRTMIEVNEKIRYFKNILYKYQHTQKRF